MFRVSVMLFNGTEQEIASCLSHIPWTMKELKHRRVILKEGLDDDTCMACLKQVDITLELPVLTSGDASGS